MDWQRCRRLCNTTGGTIELRSEPGHGGAVRDPCFRFIHIPATVPSVAPAAKVSGETVMVVDDERIAREIAVLVEAEGYSRDSS